MKTLAAALALALGSVASIGTAEAACNVRGQFCGYPSWAANAFSHPKDRVPNWVLDDQHRRTKAVLGYRHSSSGKVYRYR